MEELEPGAMALFSVDRHTNEYATARRYGGVQKFSLPAVNFLSAEIPNCTNRTSGNEKEKTL